MSACPTPGKMVFASRGAAKAGAKRAEGHHTTRGQLRPYRCPGCGNWHLTCMSGADARRDRARRRRAAG